jgi:hypothetical protein
MKLVYCPYDAELLGAEYRPFRKVSDSGNTRYIVNTTGQVWLPAPTAAVSTSSYYFAPSFEDMTEWLFDTLTK